MNSAAIITKRPLSCLKNSLRYASQQRPIRRLMATQVVTDAAATTTTTTSSGAPKYSRVRLSPHTIYGVPKSRRSAKFRTGFAVYTPQVKRPSTTDPLAAFHQKQIKDMDPRGARTRLFDRANREGIKVGDVLMVTTRRSVEPFSGVCLSIRRAGIDTAILLRTALTKIGVEMWFKIYSRNVVGIDVVQRRPKRARRARLTYMRQPKHDRGNVDAAVTAWRKSRNILGSRNKSAEKPGAKTKAKAGAKGTKRK
ncbi:hypothetical protein MCOR27_011659 [Pyricularia oryzae]|uniref:Ribosomal protein L19 n=5 Tax=Pyricularia TaxID=48558 RepID=A0ABQ8NA31_PYRGI|nr:uncharacterized protein MGG_06468 [Pyricularia oryzae 70-15]ELQ41906.1 hypothetical protein OOU_Y34scaffold00247g40 [Pyricularia oryzae Y34]KAH8843490.1 hypothetical protein MCOR01_004292 [Pyricularia oryzae]KAI6293741.1 hypothetical protein MCOR33_008934 [Pyricularia grisea]EHA50777.1 hypothetical protein MGG_06468 [Pyricularia oryzae 70-15]KAH9430966.1 hypothetical protein MCOR02_008283 [Pyricularia oryzae]